MFPERAKLSGPKLIAFEFEHIFVANAEAHFRDIEGIRCEFDFEVVFADDGLYAVKLIAEKLGVTVYAAVASTLFFQSGTPGFAYPRTDLPDNVRFVGPLLAHKRTVARELPHEDRLRSADSVIVVSQGTVDNKDPGKLIAPALKALTGTEHLVVATTGGRHAAELRDRFPAGNLIEDFVDFDLLLPHARLCSSATAATGASCSRS